GHLDVHLRHRTETERQLADVHDAAHAARALGPFPGPGGPDLRGLGALAAGQAGQVAAEGLTEIHASALDVAVAVTARRAVRFAAALDVEGRVRSVLSAEVVALQAVAREEEVLD